jgi:hypothetical protein
MGRASRRKRERRAWPNWKTVDGVLSETSAPVRAMTPKEAINADRPRVEPWNSRYLQYARWQGTPDPAAMMRRDEGCFPGGRMAGFILWIDGRWEQWKASKQLPRDAPLAQTHHAEFDSWLKGWVDEQTSVIIRPRVEIARPQ